MRQQNLPHYIDQMPQHQDLHRTRLNTQIWPASLYQEARFRLNNPSKRDGSAS